MMTTCLDHDPGELMIACALVFEASTPFVSLRAILSYLDMKKSTAYVVNGALMVLVFLWCRILIYPVFYVAYARQRGLTLAAALAHTPRRCSAFLLLVLLPQLYWFHAMVGGALKVLRDRKEDEASQKRH